MCIYKKILFLCSVYAISLVITGCGLFTPYKPKYVKGNLVENAKINEIQIGLNKDQVRSILGTAMVQRIFTPTSVWEYILDTNDEQIKQQYIDYLVLRFDADGDLVDFEYRL